MSKSLTVQNPGDVRAIIGQMSCDRWHAAAGNVEEIR